MGDGDPSCPVHPPRGLAATIIRFFNKGTQGGGRGPILSGPPTQRVDSFLLSGYPGHGNREPTVLCAPWVCWRSWVRTPVGPIVRRVFHPARKLARFPLLKCPSIPNSGSRPCYRPSASPSYEASTHVKKTMPIPANYYYYYMATMIKQHDKWLEKHIFISKIPKYVNYHKLNKLQSKLTSVQTYT